MHGILKSKTKKRASSYRILHYSLTHGIAEVWRALYIFVFLLLYSDVKSKFRSIENYIIPWCMVSPRFDVSCWLSSLGSSCTKTDLPSPFLSSPRLLVEILRAFGNWNTQYLLQLKRIWENKCLQVFAQVCMGGVERGRVLICWKSRNTAPMKYYHSTQIFKYSTPMK